jgi:TolB protein
VNKALLLLIALLMMPTMLFAQDKYLEVTGQGISRQLPLAIAQPKSLGGGENAALADEIADILKFDLNLAGPFSILTGALNEGSGGIRPGEFDYAPWRAIGAAFLVKSGYTISGDTITIEFRMYDVLNAKPLAGKRYTLKRSELRKVTHSFSDEVMLVATGEKGPFTSKIAFVSPASSNKEVFIMDYDGHNVQKLTNNHAITINPDFSPNGREIIYTSYKKGNPDLYRRNVTSGTEARISSRQGGNFTGAWSPDGGKIALTMSIDDNSEIYTISTDGRKLARLTNNEAIDISPVWSPDGSHIAFVSDRLGNPQIFTMAAGGSGVRRLTYGGNYNVSPHWSPKGDRILYCRQQSGGFQIYSINPDGSGDTQLTTEGRNEYPRWSADGRFITFSSNRDGREAIYVMRADGTGQTKVSRSGRNESQPTWSARW